MLQTGTEVFIEKAGSGWRKIEGYSATVISADEALKFYQEGGFIEGIDIERLNLEKIDRTNLDKEGIFFVEVGGLIFKDDEGENSDLDEEEREVEFDTDTVWAVKEDEHTVFIIKNVVQSTKEKILEQMKTINDDTEILSGFTCLGTIDNVYPDLPEEVLECYRTWIWEWHDKSFRMATWDLGNGYCSFICEGSPEELIKHLPAKE